MPPLQSGFRKFHSMESLMVSLLADILHDVDRSHVILLSLYDISAAFDTVDHTILLDLLSIGRLGWKHPYSLATLSNLCLVQGTLLFIVEISDVKSPLPSLAANDFTFKELFEIYLGFEDTVAVWLSASRVTRRVRVRAFSCRRVNV